MMEKNKHGHQIGCLTHFFVQKKPPSFVKLRLRSPRGPTSHGPATTSLESNDEGTVWELETHHFQKRQIYFKLSRDAAFSPSDVKLQEGI
jgi:hypothetical protein